MHLDGIKQFSLGTLMPGLLILLSQLHELQSLRFDYSFVWVQGYVGIMLRHVLSKAPKGVLSTFKSLEMVDYGGTVRLTGEIEAIKDLEYVDGYPYCDPQQFMPWFYFPSLTSLSIWLWSMEGNIDVNTWIAQYNIPTCINCIHSFFPEQQSRKQSFLSFYSRQPLYNISFGHSLPLGRRTRAGKWTSYPASLGIYQQNHREAITRIWSTIHIYPGTTPLIPWRITN